MPTTKPTPSAATDVPVATSAATTTPPTRKAAAKPASSTPAVTKTPKVPKPAKRAPSPAAAPVEPVADAPEAGTPKLKLVRDSFTIPEAEYAQLDALKRRALVLAHHAKKSELLRAGIAALVALDDAALLSALQAIPPLKTGRPKAGKVAKAEAESVAAAAPAAPSESASLKSKAKPNAKSGGKKS
ncbi:MAG: hypothetical protein AB3X44_09100 [Leptothrix sp. (in: b-proteobacteria)]